MLKLLAAVHPFLAEILIVNHGTMIFDVAMAGLDKNRPFLHFSLFFQFFRNRMT